jgi:hypothetical protein
MSGDGRQFSTALIGTIVAIIGAACSLVAQNRDTLPEAPVYRSSFGLTRNEAVVFVGDSGNGTLSSTRAGIAGVQYTYTLRPDRTLDLLMDAEFQIGLIERGSAPALTSTHLFGGHATVGPRTKLWTIPIFLHALGGVSALRLTGDSVTVGGSSSSPTIYYVGGSRSDAAFRTFLNTYRTSRNRTVVEFPGSSRVSPVANIGLSSHWGRARFSGDFLRIDDEGALWGVIRAGVGFRF